MSLKRIILFAFAIMAAGTLLDLYLLGHYEDKLQLIPLLCIGLLVLTTLLLLFFRTPLVKGFYKFILVITGLSGIYGTYLHLQVNYEFELEMMPTEGAWTLFIESLSGALPALAPFSMIVLALIGYSYLIIINQKQ